MQTITLTVFLAMFFLFIVNGLVFFRKGKHTVGWFMTLLPFLLSAIFSIFFWLRWSDGVVELNPLVYANMQIAGSLLCIGAIILYAYTLGSHRVPLPMWHQQNDIPHEIVTWGAYRYIRHPFYSSYFLYYSGLLLAVPSWPVILTAVYAFSMLVYTAIKEERELGGSAHAETYRSYMKKTGRFCPPVARRQFEEA
jgi:steroid 5-alpha reductase family enzyme